MALKKRIFVSPLNWGLGHASRCVSLINELLNQDAEPIIGADGNAALFLKEIFPQLNFVVLPDYKVQYKYDSMVLNIALQLPSLISTLKKERIICRQIVKDYKIQGIISDNRYGLPQDGIPSVFVGHQLNIKVPGLLISKAVNNQNRKLLAKFDSVWVPDTDSPNNLSAELSRDFKHSDIRFIGSLSRLNPDVEPQIGYKIVAVLSGPEPQRTFLEKILTAQLIELDIPSLLIRGVLEKGYDVQFAKLRIKNFADETELASLIKGAELFVSRSGYSTIMDLAKMKSGPLLLIPTPGQTEQEYLAKRFSDSGSALLQHQNKIDIKFAWENRNKSLGLYADSNDSRMKEAMKVFLDSIK